MSREFPSDSAFRLAAVIVEDYYRRLSSPIYRPCGTPVDGQIGRRCVGHRCDRRGDSLPDRAARAASSHSCSNLYAIFAWRPRRPLRPGIFQQASQLAGSLFIAHRRNDCLLCMGPSDLSKQRLGHIILDLNKLTGLKHLNFQPGQLHDAGLSALCAIWDWVLWQASAFPAPGGDIDRFTICRVSPCEGECRGAEKQTSPHWIASTSGYGFLKSSPPRGIWSGTDCFMGGWWSSTLMVFDEDEGNVVFG